MTLTDDEIQVWSIALDLSAEPCSGLYELLSAQERSRAATFLRQNDQRRFIATRGLLRRLLSIYLRYDAAEFLIGSNAFGKPELCNLGEAPAEIRFNYSHSNSLAVFAFARSRRVGVDVECVEADVARDSIAERFFCPREVAALRALPKARQSTAFFKCWTRKEAYVKARGEGFSIPLESFDVSSDRIAVEAGCNSRWSVLSFEPLPGYMAAVAAEGWDWRFALINQQQPNLFSDAKSRTQTATALKYTGAVSRPLI
jgi:4'-phosphopantetheinyl transferase